ncbi:hypothetical protein K461DRAFT_223323 [Myriangium duriaei CBS 260.36]|uniref:25S rRNA (Uridine(2843)-N(3))-methyltransferase n=1 Tax=Myriangium duriaei CBS 260.36 TaxID=1168546 RepID=A0A9P4J7V4_9PEZI|nr:hypothetical protein K461DRAFT_223323 [Myriangium duriaei CBS 260.36]
MAKGKSSHPDRRKPSSAPAKESSRSDTETAVENNIPERLQQQILDAFRDAFSQSLDFDLAPVIQKVKQHLYDRNFAAAFGSEQHLLAYAARWSVSRALGYLQIFHDISSFNPPAYGVNAGIKDLKNDKSQSSMRITCLGGGAGAELVASAAWLRLQSEISSENPTSIFGQAAVDPNSLEVNCLDIADWASVVSRLDEAVKTAPTISKYASAAAKADNMAMLPADAMRSIFIQQDLLEAHPDNIRALFHSSDLVTIMFTLNELYSASVSKTQRLLFELTVATRPGTLLLVVDSPGSYSTVQLNNTEKKYPMHWLLDHTLLEASKNTRILPRANHWQKLITDESRWFRVPKALKYPIELENMRYQIHLYRRLGVPDDPAAPGPSVSKPQR